MNRAKQIQHLHWRAGFGQSPKEWKQAQQQTVEGAVAELFQAAGHAKLLPELGLDLLSERKEGLSPEEKRALQKRSNQLLAKVNTDWIARMSDPDESAFLERMCLFWHGHFACESKNPITALRQLNSLRTHALGKFKDLLLAIAQDPSMIRYLNNQQNRKRAPNENFARELLELFTIGIGQYSEADIKEAARAFTGWSSNRAGEFVFRARQHDYGSKTFMGRTGDFDGEAIIDIILEQAQTAHFIVRKVYRYFVNEQVDEARVQALAKQFRASDYDIGQLMYSIFTSKWFYEPKNSGTKIKSPVELIAGVIRSLHIKNINPQMLLRIQRVLGQMLFKPPNVAGWKGGHAWIDNATLMLRLNLVEILTKKAKINKSRLGNNDEILQAPNKNNGQIELDLSYLFKELNTASEIEVYKYLINYLLAANPNLDASEIMSFVDKSSQENYIKSLVLRLLSLPEYQLC